MTDIPGAPLLLAALLALCAPGCHDRKTPGKAASGSAPAQMSSELRLDYATYNPSSLILKSKGWLEQDFARDGIAVRWVFSAVDALTRMSLQELVLSIWQRTRITMLLVTHDLDEAIYLSDRVFVLSATPPALIEVLSIALPRPRDRRDPELARRRVQLMESLHVAGVASAGTRRAPDAARRTSG